MEFRWDKNFVSANGELLKMNTVDESPRPWQISPYMIDLPSDEPLTSIDWLVGEQPFLKNALPPKRD